MPTNTTVSAPASTAAIFERAGFEIRNGRAVCPYCQDGHRVRKLTVAIRGELWFCHRCHAGGSVRTLANQQGVPLPPVRIRKANIPKSQFRAWMLDRMDRLGSEERKAYRKLECVNTGFSIDYEPVWEFLSWFYT